MFDPCPFVRAPMAVSARAILDSTLQRTTTRLGSDQRAAFPGQGSQGFDALDTMRRHHWRADLTPSPRMSQRLDDEILVQMLWDGSWSLTTARLGLSWVPVLADAGLRP